MNNTVFFNMLFPFKICLFTRLPEVKRLFRLLQAASSEVWICCVSLRFVLRKQIFDRTLESLFAMVAVFARLTLVDTELTFLREQHPSSDIFLERFCPILQMVVHILEIGHEEFASHLHVTSVCSLKK